MKMHIPKRPTNAQ